MNKAKLIEAVKFAIQSCEDRAHHCLHSENMSPANRVAGRDHWRQKSNEYREILGQL